MKNNKSTYVVTAIFLLIQGLTLAGYISRHEYSNLVSLSGFTLFFIIYSFFRIHVFASYSYSLFGYSIIANFYPPANNSLKREFILIVTIGATLGMLFEIGEFIADTAVKPPIPISLTCLIRILI